MKKKYIKPELFFEQYMLNQHMAATCLWDWDGFEDAVTCVAVGTKFGTEGMVIFQEQAVCYMMNGGPESYCYQTAVNEIGTFGSGGA